MRRPFFGLILLSKGTEIFETCYFMALGAFMHILRISFLNMLFHYGHRLIPNVESTVIFACLILFFSRFQFRYSCGLPRYYVHAATAARFFISMLITEFIMDCFWIPVGKHMYAMVYKTGFPFGIIAGFRTIRILFTCMSCYILTFFAGLYKLIWVLQTKGQYDNEEERLVYIPVENLLHHLKLLF